MSYEKVKSIKIESDKVLINSASNNVRPLTYTTWKAELLTKLLLEKGRKAVEIAILKAHEEGSFESNITKYKNALKVLRFVFKDEYKAFNWNNSYSYGSEEYKKVNELRESKEFEELLSKCLDYKLPEPKFFIQKDYWGSVAYGKMKISSMGWLRELDKATKYTFEEEAERVLSLFGGASKDWIIGVIE